MKNDEVFELYLRVMAASKDPSEVAEMIIGKDWKLTDTQGKVLLLVPAAVAAKIFTIVLNRQGMQQHDIDRFNNGNSEIFNNQLFSRLLYGMEAKMAVETLLLIDQYVPNKPKQDFYAIATFFDYMYASLCPKATASILAIMPNEVALPTFREYSAAIADSMRPFLKELNPALEVQLFSQNVQDARNAHDHESTSRLASVFFAMNPQEIASTLQQCNGIGKNDILDILHEMFIDSNAMQKVKIAQILCVFYQKGLLDYSAEGDDIDFMSIFQRNMQWCKIYAWYAWIQVLMENLSDDVYANLRFHLATCMREAFSWSLSYTRNLPDNTIVRLVCRFSKDERAFILSPFPEERREKIQNLIATIGTKEP
jgi:hypothetical protein